MNIIRCTLYGFILISYFFAVFKDVRLNDRGVDEEENHVSGRVPLLIIGLSVGPWVDDRLDRDNDSLHHDLIDDVGDQKL
jgi:hypothetical protein